MAQNLPATKQDERAVVYQAADGQEIKLTADLVKKYLVQGKSELVTTQELMYFLNICKARKLNPLVKDCYLVKYSQGEGAAIITSVDFFRKRARAQKDCKGWKKGVLVRDTEGKVRDSFGLVMEGETLVGGWFEALPEGWLEPFRLEVNLKGYLKKTSEGKVTKFWSEDNQPTMIAKVAEAQGLRTLWPDEFQQMYEESEGPGMDGNSGMPIIDVGEDAPDNAITDRANLLLAFETSIPKNADTALVEAFLAKIAEGNKKTVEEIKLATAADQKELDNLWKLFPAWCKQQAAKNGKAKETAPQSDATPEDRFDCPNGGYANLAACENCKWREPKAGDLCPAFESHRK